jgi:hypothetical protein
MTIGAIRGIFSPGIMSFSMAAFEVILKQLCVAGGTVHRPVGGAGPLQVVTYLRMTFGTGNVLMYRVGEFIGISVQGNTFPVHHHMDVFLPVAFHTGIVGYPGLNLRYRHLMRGVTRGASRDHGRIFFP